MLYTYECRTHGTFDEVLSVHEFKRHMPCPECGKRSRNVITIGHGGIWRNDSSWVRDASKVFEFDGNRPMETVSDLKSFLQSHPNIKPKESHPALPSSIGDCHRPPDEATRRKAIKRKAMEYLRSREALTVTSGTSA